MTGQTLRVAGYDVNPEEHGALVDNAADDLGAWTNSLAAMGPLTRMRAGRVKVPNGTSRLSDTLLVRRFSGVVSGPGSGSSRNNHGALKWAGPAGVPMMRLQQCWQARVQDLRLIGNPNAKPSAAVEMHVGTGEASPHNTGCQLQNVWIGSMSGEDADNAAQFDNGVVFNGVNVQNDQCSIDNCHIEGVTDVGVDIRNSQCTIISLTNDRFNAMTTGVKTRSRGLSIEHPFFSSITGECVLLAADSGVTIRNIGAEGCARLVRGFGGIGCGVNILGEYFQCGAAVMASDGFIVDLAGAGTVNVENVFFNGADNIAEGYAKIRLRGPSVTLALKSVGWYDSTDATKFLNHLDLATENPGDSRLVIFDYKGARYTNYWQHGDATTLGLRFDNPGPP